MLDYERLDVYQCSAMECGAITDVVRLVGGVPEAELVAAKALLVRMVGMLTRLCR
jgi:hypothetical protein